MMKKLLFLALLMPLATIAQTLSVDFEDGLVPPDGWTVQQTNALQTWIASAETPIAGTTSATVMYDETPGDQDEWLISPSLDFSASTTLALNFLTSQSYYWGVTPNDNYDTTVEISLDSGMSWEPIWSENDLGVFTSWVATNVSIDLSSYAGNPDVKLAFHYVGNDGAQWILDSVKLVSCIVPGAGTVTDITTTSATATWAGNASNYEIALGAPGFTPGEGTLFTTTGSPYNFSLLSPSTTYEFYIRSICSESSQSEWVGPFRFTTLCDGASNVPMIQDFESATPPELPACSSTENAGTGNDWTVTANNGYGFTSNALRYKWSVPSAANAWYFTQAVNLTGGQSYTLSYKYGNSGGTTYVESMKVSYGMSATSAGMAAEPLADHPAITNSVTPITNTVSFTPATTGVYYLGFNAYSIADRFYLFVDDIALDVTLGTQQFDASQFAFYPNPVKDMLNLSYAQSMSAVEVYNLLGQKVISEIINANQKQVNMTGLSSGSYMVKVYSGDMVKTIKVVKQ